MTGTAILLENHFPISWHGHMIKYQNQPMQKISEGVIFEIGGIETR